MNSFLLILLLDSHLQEKNYSSASTIEKLQNEINSLKTEKICLEAQMKQKTREFDVLLENIKNLENQKTQHESNLTNVQQMLKEFQSKVLELESVLNILKTEKSHITKELREKQDFIDNLQDQLNNSIKNTEQLKFKLDEAERKYRKELEQTAELTQALREQTQAQADFESRIESLNAELNSQQQQVNKLIKENR